MEEIERLRTEIERRRDNLGPVEFDIRKRTKFDVYEGLLSYIDSHFPKTKELEDLEDALKAKVDEELKDPVFGKLINTFAAYAFAKQIVNWHKEQMMKGAVDLKINRDILYDLKPLIHERYLDFKIGDKVKLIILPSNNK